MAMCVWEIFYVPPYMPDFPNNKGVRVMIEIRSRVPDLLEHLSGVQAPPEHIQSGPKLDRV